jgi:hypothetical protein
MQRVGVMALALAAMTLLAGCGGGSDAEEPSAPEGWKVTESEFFSFSHPSDWSVRTRPAPTGTEGETVTQVTAPRSGGDPLAVIVVGATPKFTSGFDGAVELNESNALVRFPGRKKIGERDLDVPGAKDAKLVESEVPAGTTAGAPRAPVRIFDVIAMSEEDTAVNMAAQVLAADVDRSRVRDVLDSLRLR